MRGYDLVAQAAAEATIFARISRNGGSAGAPSVLSCADHPFSVKTSWLATASHQSTTPRNLPSALVDGTNARWSSGKAQSGDEWIQIDFGSTVSLRSINLQQGSDTNDYPRSYAVIISDTKNDLTGVVRASGIGTSGVTTTIQLPKVIAGRYFRSSNWAARSVGGPSPK